MSGREVAPYTIDEALEAMDRLDVTFPAFVCGVMSSKGSMLTRISSDTIKCSRLANELVKMARSEKQKDAANKRLAALSALEGRDGE